MLQLDPGAAPPLYIHGLGHFHPEDRIDNAFLMSLDIGTDDAWILERVGIRARRTVLPLDYLRATHNADPRLSAAASRYTNAETGARAATLALARAGISPSQIGLVIAGGCSPQHTAPAEACTIAAELGIRAPSFDMNSACSSFAVQLHNLRATRPEALPDYVLVVNAENNTRAIDYRDRRAAVLWGDASAAAVVSTRVPARLQVVASVIDSDPSGWDKVYIPTGGHFAQQGQVVQTFAVRRSLATLRAVAEHATVATEELYFVGHQANLTMLQGVVERAGISPTRHLYNVDEYGNCGAAGAPSVLSQRAWALEPGAELVVGVVGSGLTWGGLLLRYGKGEP